MAKKKNDEGCILNEDTNFMIQEAYKAIRTNLILSFSSEKCRTILFTSALHGEYKSTTTINMGIAFAMNNMKVLVIDCDLRMSSIANKLHLESTPGLTDYLAGQCKKEEIIVKMENGLHLITAGTFAPNPSELLGSAKMKELITELEKQYDYILLDSTPICEVSDAIVLSSMADGVVLTVRQLFSDRISLNETINKLKVANARILGFILAGAGNGKKKNTKGYYAKPAQN